MQLKSSLKHIGGVLVAGSLSPARNIPTATGSIPLEFRVRVLF